VCREKEKRMAWNEIPARDDADLAIQVYYARINVIYSTLPRCSRMVFDNIRESANRSEFAQFKKSALLGLTMKDIIHALGLMEVTEFEAKNGDWFVHSGVTKYRSLAAGLREASITLASKVIREER
jgi:hypothetical protein